MSTHKPLLSRPLDAVYIVWFALHLVIMFCVDLVPLYPESVKPGALLHLREWYITTYNDRFFVSPPAWFTSFMYMEALYHVPLSIWAVGALIRDDPLVPVHLLVWSVQTFITTLTCIIDFFSWTAVTKAELQGLCGLYGPYCALAAFMGLETFLRLKSKLLQQQSHKKSD